MASPFTTGIDRLIALRVTLDAGELFAAARLAWLRAQSGGTQEAASAGALRGAATRLVFHAADILGGC